MSVPIARRNSLHEKGKLALGIAGVAASITMILLILGLQAGLYATLTAYVENLGADIIVAQSGVQGIFSSDSSLPLDIHEEVQSAAGAQEAGHILTADVIFSRNGTKTPVILVGFVPGSAFGDPWDIGEGRLVEADDEIMLDTWLARRSQAELGDTVEILGQEFTVVGLTRGTSSWMSPYIFMSLDAAESALGVSGVVSYHLLKLPGGVDREAAINAIDTEIPGADALTPGEIAKADQRILSAIMDVPINTILVISIVTGIAVMGLIAYTSVADRTREYGVLKAIGAGPWRLALLVTNETLILTVFGFLFGIGLTFLSANTIMKVWPQFNILIQLPLILQVGVLSLLMTSIAALLPIRRIRQIDPLLVFKD